MQAAHLATATDELKATTSQEIGYGATHWHCRWTSPDSHSGHAYDYNRRI